MRAYVCGMCVCGCRYCKRYCGTSDFATHHWKFLGALQLMIKQGILRVCACREVGVCATVCVSVCVCMQVVRTSGEWQIIKVAEDVCPLAWALQLSDEEVFV